MVEDISDTASPGAGSVAAGSSQPGQDYDVVILAEQELSQLDADQVLSLHEGLDDPVRYHVLIPVDNAAARIEGGIGSLGAGELMAGPAMVMTGEDLEELQQQLIEDCRESITRSVALLSSTGSHADGKAVTEEPIGALAGVVQSSAAAEAIILTRPHVVAEFFHIDWTSRARRKLGVPVLHLIEHETFDEQSGRGEGITGL